MSYRAGAAILAILTGVATPVVAQTLPAVQLTPSNQPTQCTTPGRLMAFIKARNPRLATKFESIASDYMRHGRNLGVRWDYAFYQMVVETNSLKYTGDVHPSQNNFAGLGATGGGVRGEAFRTVSDGVRAHLEHLMIYAGIHVADPVADRTRKVQSWGILDKWRARIRGPVTYGDVGSKWAPVDRGYSRDIQSIADAFNKSQCRRPDPRPDLMADAGGQRSSRAPYSRDSRQTLGAREVAARTQSSNSAPPRSYRTLNAPNTEAQDQGANQRTAATFAAPNIQQSAPEQAPAEKCRVWTASYGGQKATIIQSASSGTVNYTVLDINNGREDAEADAYIAAYAKGGKRIGDYPSKSAAMDKAFKLCPKG